MGICALHITEHADHSIDFGDINLKEDKGIIRAFPWVKYLRVGMERAVPDSVGGNSINHLVKV